MQKDYIIVGQGIAGSLLAAALVAAGKTVLVIDNAHSESSSMVAAGDVNPITGQRFVKTWKFEALREAMIPMYSTIAGTAGNTIVGTIVETIAETIVPTIAETIVPTIAETIVPTIAETIVPTMYNERRILRVLHNAKAHNDWQARTAWEAWQGNIGDEKTVDKAAFEAQFKGVFGIAEILQGGKVEIQKVLNTIKNNLTKSDSLITEKFDFDSIYIDKKYINYILSDKTQICANGIIFCEGWQAIRNPYFNYLPFQVSKGESLVVRLPKTYSFGHYTVKNDVTISHLYDDLYWIGATNSFEFVTSKPTENARAELIKRLENALNLPFEVVEHRAGIRPTVKDRRPLVGQHPQYKNLYIFNGLGTKGASLAPYLVNCMMAFLDKNTPLEADIDIARYASFWQDTEF